MIFLFSKWWGPWGHAFLLLSFCNDRDSVFGSGLPLATGAVLFAHNNNNNKRDSMSTTSSGSATVGFRVRGEDLLEMVICNYY